MASWEFESSTKMLSLLVGDAFGDKPEARLSEIISEKHSIATQIISLLSLSNRDRVLEIGPGCGYLAQVISPQVETLLCCDISESFLNVTRQNCAQYKNMSYQQIESGSLSKIADSSLTAIYANNVFIHLNIFDYFLYFKEFARVMVPSGRLWFDGTFYENMGSLSDLERMSEEYARDHRVLIGLLQYTSKEAIIRIADRFGFSPLPQQMNPLSLAFVKRQ